MLSGDVRVVGEVHVTTLAPDHHLVVLGVDDHPVAPSLDDLDHAEASVDAWAGEEGLLIRAEIPGVGADDLDISVDGRNLTLSGNRAEAMLPEEACHYRSERIGGEFTRSVELPFDIDMEAVKASFTDGVLEIELPRLPEEKPRKIAINGS